MRTLALAAVGLVAAIHLYILYLEMFLWDTPRGRVAFGLTPEMAAATKTLALNQGLYNGFLAAGSDLGDGHFQRVSDGVLLDLCGSCRRRWSGDGSSSNPVCANRSCASGPPAAGLVLNLSSVPKIVVWIFPN